MSGIVAGIQPSHKRDGTRSRSLRGIPAITFWETRMARKPDRWGCVVPQNEDDGGEVPGCSALLSRRWISFLSSAATRCLVT